MPEIAPQDPDGVVAALPAELQASYNGFPQPVQASAWADWKPSDDGPWDVAVLWQPPMNTFVSNTHKGLMDTLEASGNVNVVADLAPKDPTDVPGQLQQFNQAVAQKPDLIILMPLAAEPFIEPIEAAAEAGIPTVTPWLPVPTKSAIGISQNDWLAAAKISANVAASIGGKGDALMVHGIPGITSDTNAFAAFESVLALCPDIKQAGEVTGNFSTAATQAAVLQFLSTHPGEIAAVFQAGVMTPGVIQAFEQLGRPVPAIADLGSTQGSIAYAYENQDTYKEFGGSVPDEAIGRVAADVALRTLSGDGPKVSTILTELKPIDNTNLDKVYQEGWTVNGSDDAWFPDDTFMEPDVLDQFFNRAAQ
ncbi:substrate-binding domain-containing protein [Georgenia thermotolerans]|uniref:substrate-binding domain-containing protein n=1 Tax=Georgenia thermotolerans TaxID=527326 RepID=UPI001478E0E9|nr:substrate-binding domain-containing protein [Georgenia thermotolerans]